MDISCYYEEADFTEAEFSEDSWEGKTFNRCRFRSADFSGMTLIRCRFEQCDFTAASFNGVTVQESAFLNCRFLYANCFGTFFDGCKMTGTTFEESNCTALRIQGGDWSYTLNSKSCAGLYWKISASNRQIFMVPNLINPFFADAILMVPI